MWSRVLRDDPKCAAASQISKIGPISATALRSVSASTFRLIAVWLAKRTMNAKPAHRALSMIASDVTMAFLKTEPNPTRACDWCVSV